MIRAGHRRPPAALARQPAGLVIAEGGGDQAAGALGLPVGQQVRAVLPVRDHAQPPPGVFGQAGQRLVHPGQVGWPVIGLGQAHAGQQGADAQLPGAHPDGQHGLDPRRGAGGVDDLLEHRQRDHGRRAAPSSRTAQGLAGRLQPGEQVAEPLGAADPGRCHERGQPEQLRAVGQPRRPQPGWCPAAAARPRRPARPRAGSSGSGAPDRSRRRSARSRRTGPWSAAGPDSGPAPELPGLAGPCTARPRRRTGTPRRCRGPRASRRGSARRRLRGRSGPPPASAAPRWAERPRARDSRRSAPGCRAAWTAPGAAADPRDTTAAPPGGR